MKKESLRREQEYSPSSQGKKALFRGRNSPPEGTSAGFRNSDTPERWSGPGGSFGRGNNSEQEVRNNPLEDSIETERILLKDSQSRTEVPKSAMISSMNPF